jgi:hypothetical protein
MSVDAYFGARPTHERLIFDAVADHLGELGPVIIEPVSVGILFKGARRTFVELRPRTRWVQLTFRLDRTVVHSRITRTTRDRQSGRTYHGVRLTGPADVDTQVRAWLTESYLSLAG